MSQKQQQMDQKQQERNEQYNAYVKQVTPTHNLWANMGKAFVMGGAICLLGQIILNIAMGVFGVKQDDAALWCSLILVLLSVILTSFNVYGLLANWGGAGALVPITGFANDFIWDFFELGSGPYLLDFRDVSYSLIDRNSL